MADFIYRWLYNLRAREREMPEIYSSRTWFSASAGAKPIEPSFRQMTICDTLPTLEATKICEVVTDLRIWKFFCFVFTITAFLFFYFHLIKATFSRLKKIVSWIWGIRIWRPKSDNKMPPVLTEKTPLDVDKWIRQVDLYTEDLGCSRADALITLVKEKLTDIL